MQAGISVGGAFVSPISTNGNSQVYPQFSPLKTMNMPQILDQGGKSLDWDYLVGELKENCGDLLEGKNVDFLPKPVEINKENGVVSIFLPGFDKSEVKLSQVKLQITRHIFFTPSLFSPFTILFPFPNF